MKIARSAARERILLDAFRASFAREERTGVHLSDLMKPRKSFWGRRLPIPPTDTECLYFLAGRGHEEVFARLCGVQVGATEVKHVPIPGLVAGEQRFKHVISYRPDFRWDELPMEFKTRRKNLAKPGEEALVYDEYIEQHRGYCALDGVPGGFLAVLSLLEGSNGDPLTPTRPELAVYEIVYQAEELAVTEARLIELRDAFIASLEQGDHATLPLCPAWACGKNRKHVLEPAYCVECKREYAEPWASKHTNTKVGAGHTVRPEKVAWSYEPRCKFYVFCRPQLVDATRGPRE